MPTSSEQTSLATTPPPRVTLEDIEALVVDIVDIVDEVKAIAFTPTDAKLAPKFGTTQVAQLCRISHDTMLRRLEKAEEFGLPIGTLTNEADPEKPTINRRKKREFTLEETARWITASKLAFRRPPNVPGCVMAIGNFKGGVGKTTIAMSLAQGLSLKGYRVLCIDFDPQGSLTTLFGIDPTDVVADQTFLPLAAVPSEEGARSTIRESIQKTYWHNVDLVAGFTGLFSGEFWLPTRQMNALNPENDDRHEKLVDGVVKKKDPKNFRFYEVLAKGLQGVELEYDYIIIDTPPALSYMTMNAFWASDAILMPLPPEGLDFASSAQFWSMFTELASGTGAPTDTDKSFSWIGVVPSKVDGAKNHTKSLLKAMQGAYGKYLTTAQIPQTDAAKTAAMKMRTVYDIAKYVGGNKTYARARDAFDQLVEEVDHLTRQKLWGQL
jgi:chromosome partitioning protein